MCDLSARGTGYPVAAEQLLPPEIWEIILNKLEPWELVKAACVSCWWRHLATRICRTRCQCLPPRLLAELLHEHKVTPKTSVLDQGTNNADDIRTSFKCQKEVEEPNWLDISRMYIQTIVTSDPNNCSEVLHMKNVTHLASSSRFVVVVCGGEAENLHILRLVGKAGQECCSQTISGRINKVCVMEMPETSPVLVLCVERNLRCYLVEPELCALFPLAVKPELSVDSRLSCDGNTLIVSQMVGEHHLAVYEASFLPETRTIELTHKGRIRTTSPPVYWDLWNGFVTTIVSGGHVSSYTLSGNLVAESPLYKDLRYPNPTLLARGLVFASTLTSRTLLSYWHMDRERDYWLVGESILTSWIQRGSQAVGNTSWNTASGAEKHDSTLSTHGQNITDEAVESSLSSTQPASSCIVTLAKVRIGATVLLEVTVVHYKRGLVFCGTSQGHLLIYNILTNDQASNVKVNWAVMESYIPSLYLSVTSCPISRLTSYFRNAHIIVAIADRDENCKIISLPNIQMPSECCCKNMCNCYS
ncbi:uncharacterized protein [Procambarus clarkii]|uniref:uncharacterized protein isoform X1 n=1 Tax=Procambarus clarkii TaxID=6728 RepID=UPI003743930D